MIHFIKRNLPKILVTISCGGVVGTSILAIKNTQKAEEELNIEKTVYNSLNGDNSIDDFKSYKRDVYLKHHITTILSAGATCLCIIGSNHLNKRHELALISVCNLLSETYSDYRHKVIEHHGVEEDRQILHEIAVEHAKPVDIYSCGAFAVPSLSTAELSRSDYLQLFYDGFSRRFFKSTLARVVDAEYNLNRNFCLGDVIPLNEWYEFLGLEQTIEGNELGWFLGVEDDYLWLDFSHERRYLDDGTPYIYIDMMLPPSIKWQEEC